MNAAAPPPSSRRRRRVLPIAALILLASVVVAILVAPAVLRRFGEKTLAEAGFPQAEIAGVSLASGGLRIAQLDLAPEGRFRLADIRIRLSWQSLRAGRAERISVGAAALEAELADDGTLALPGYRPPEAAASEMPASPPDIPLETASLGTATLRLATPAGPVTVILEEIQADIEAAGVRLDALFAAEHAAGRLSGKLAARAALDTGRYTTNVDILSGEAATAGLTLERLEGAASLTLEPDLPLTVSLDLSAGEAAFRDLPLGAMALNGKLEAGQLTARLHASSEGAVGIDLAGSAELDGQKGRLSGTVEIDDLGAVADLAASAAGPLGGRLRLVPDLVLDWKSSMPQAHGRIEIEAQDLTAAGLIERAQLRFIGDLRATPETVEVTARKAWSGEILPAADVLPEALAPYAGAPLRVTLSPQDDAQAMRLDISLPERAARLAGALSVEAAQSRMTAAGDVSVAATQEGIAIEARPLAISASDLQWQELALDIADFEGRAMLAPDGAWRLAGAASLIAEGAIGALGIENGEIAWSGRIAGDATRLRLFAERCIDIRAGALSLDDLRIEDLAPPCLAPQDGKPLLRYDMAESVKDLAIQAASAPLDLTIAQAGERMPLNGRWPGLSLTARLGADGAEAIDAELTGGALEIAGRPYRANGLDAALRMAGGRIEAAALTLAEIASLREPALFAPIQLEATAKPAETGDVLEIEAFLSDSMGFFVFEASGQGTLQAGTLDLTLYPIRFLPDATEAVDLSPALGALISDLRGSVGFSGKLSWSEAGASSGGEVDFGPLSFTAAGLQLSALQGSPVFDSLIPPTTATPQEIRLGTANIGLLLTDGRLRFDLEPDGRIAVSDLRFDLAGGNLSADPFILDLSRLDDTTVMMRADDVDLEKLVMLSGIDGLEGIGRLTGRLPLTLTAEGLSIADGVLAAAGDGVLRYVPTELPAFLRGDDLRSRMLRQALRNFQYEALSLTLSGDVGARQRIALSARGANPDFLEGHPVELDVTVQGPLVSVVQSVIGGSGARALERMFRDSDGAPEAAAERQENRP